MNKEESLTLYKKGRDAWNAWAELMLAQRDKLTETGEWIAEWGPEWMPGELCGTLRQQGKNAATQDWLAAARSDFSGLSFENLVDFSSFVFPADVEFAETKFENKAFICDATFNGYAGFWKATFSDYAEFGDTKFNGDADFSNAAFSGGVGFSATKFGGEARFWNATLSPFALFRGATFSADAGFPDVMFGGNLDFAEAKFNDYAEFRDAIFSGYVSFRGAKFSGDAGFGEAKFNENTVFNQAVFESSANFSGTTFQKEVSFIAIKGQKLFTLEDAVFFLVPDFGQAHFAEAPRLDNSRFGIAYRKPRLLRGQNPASVKRDVTACWRTLKRLAVQGHDHERELDFLAEGIKSMRGVQDWLLPNPLSLRKGEPICWPGGGRYWAGLFYQWFSDFGRSSARPLLWWVIVTTAFAFCFHYLSPHSDPDSNDPLSIASCSGSNPVTAALYLSINNGLVISGLGHTEKLAQSYACLYGNDGKDRLSPIMPDAVVFAGIVQTIFSAVLIFLFLLGLRNYFRIK